jgi:hypothetical protein
VTSLAELCLDFFLLGHAHLAAGEAGHGLAFERRVRAHLGRAGLPNSGGFSVFGRHSMSGLYHQLDEQTRCERVLVVGEWKAYTGQIPKNDLLRFKAATDDYWLAESTRRDTPIMRVFGGTGRVTDAMRAYAAQSSIILVTPDRWPVPTLCDPDLLWSAGELESPPRVDTRAMATLASPLSDVLRPCPDGSWWMPRISSPVDLATRFAVWRHWSDRAWSWWIDDSPARFERLMDARTAATGVLA